MSTNSIDDNKPHLNRELLKLAVNGTSDYHYLMTSILHQSLMLKAGYIPNKTDAPLPTKNPEHWQTKKQHMNAGNLWIFYATEYGHFAPSEARLIWKYGQLQLLKKKVIRQIERSVQRPNVLVDTLRYVWTNPADFGKEPNDNEYWYLHVNQDKCMKYYYQMQERHDDSRNHPYFYSAYAHTLFEGVDSVYGGTPFQQVLNRVKTLCEHLEDEREAVPLV